MDLYGYFGFLAGIGIAWWIWRPSNPVPGGLIFRAYYGYCGKLDKILYLLDEDYIYDDYIEKYDKISYFTYCKAVEAYRPVALAQLREFYRPYIIHILLKRNLPLLVIVLPIFVFAIHWLLLGMVIYCILRYVYHYLVIIRQYEPLTLTNILSANAVSYYYMRKNPETNKRTKNSSKLKR